MASFDTRAAWTYHDSTKHSLESVQSSRHVLDWANKPLPFKIYPTLEPIPLPREVPASGIPALDAVAGRVDLPRAEAILDRSAIALVCFFANAVTKVLKRPGAEIPS